ncbi:MAG: hypothetical protein ACXVCY_07370 [Pseudobdellovibrionaceae bacterium]
MNKYFLALIALTFSGHHASAQEAESVHKEAPYVQGEKDFESTISTPQPKTNSENPAAPTSVQTPAPSPTSAPSPSPTTSTNQSTSSAPATATSLEQEVQSATDGLSEKKQSAELNKTPNSDSNKMEEELRIEDEKPNNEKPVVDQPSIIPVEPTAEVKSEPSELPPNQQSQTSKVLRQSKGKVEYIEHPLAAKGLTTITKDGAYIYKTADFAEKNTSGAFRVGMIDPPKIISADGSTDFSQMYSGQQQPLIMFDYEWHPFSGYGKLGIQAGMGLLVAYGNGRFTDPSLQGQQAKEKYTFVAIPLNVGVVYRLEWLHRQWFAPYVAGGGTYIPVAEIRDDGKSPTAVGTPGFYGAGGILFNISATNRETAFTLKSEYGIANLWVSLDYRYLKTVNDQLDFSSSIIGAGIVVDY